MIGAEGTNGEQPKNECKISSDCDELSKLTSDVKAELEEELNLDRNVHHLLAKKNQINRFLQSLTAEYDDLNNVVDVDLLRLQLVERYDALDDSISTTFDTESVLLMTRMDEMISRYTESGENTDYVKEDKHCDEYVARVEGFMGVLASAGYDELYEEMQTMLDDAFEMFSQIADLAQQMHTN